MKELPLVELLADGRFHSGESLGSALGVSRAAVWKRLQSLARLGLDVERVRGKGYRLAGGLSLLSEKKLREYLSQGGHDVSVQVHAETGSTNVDALYIARETLATPAAVLAEFQSSGRGRRGRDWQMPFAAGLALSLAVEFPDGAARLEGLSLAVGVCVAELLKREGVSQAALKWPNDILVSGRKLGGILIELTGDLDASCRAVIGVGLNMALPSSLAIDQPVTDLAAELGERQDRTVWAAKLLAALLEMTAQFKRKGFEAFRTRWSDYDVVQGQPVRVLQGGSEMQGVARGVTERGALRIETSGGIVELHGGEVSIRF